MITCTLKPDIILLLKLFKMKKTKKTWLFLASIGYYWYLSNSSQTSWYVQHTQSTLLCMFFYWSCLFIVQSFSFFFLKVMVNFSYKHFWYTVVCKWTKNTFKEVSCYLLLRKEFRFHYKLNKLLNKSLFLSTSHTVQITI